MPCRGRCCARVRDNKMKTPTLTIKIAPAGVLGYSKLEPPNRDLPAPSACAMNVWEHSMGTLDVHDLKKVVLRRRGDLRVRTSYTRGSCETRRGLSETAVGDAIS